jgi:hypothetical protein
MEPAQPITSLKNPLMNWYSSPALLLAPQNISAEAVTGVP